MRIWAFWSEPVALDMLLYRCVSNKSKRYTKYNSSVRPVETDISSWLCVIEFHKGGNLSKVWEHTTNGKNMLRDHTLIKYTFYNIKSLD